MPSTTAGIGEMLTAFATNIAGPPAVKYNVTSAESNSVIQAQLVWTWFDGALTIARGWSASLTARRDTLSTGAPGTFDSMPTVPTLPTVPIQPWNPPDNPIVIEHDFFARFAALVSRIKHDPHCAPADGKLLGIEGTPASKPSESVVPLPSMALVTAGHPEITCTKGVFQGFNAWLDRLGQARKFLGLSLGRHFLVQEPLSAAGTAEIWSFVVQYQYQYAPFGQLSQPVSITVRG